MTKPDDLLPRHDRRAVDSFLKDWNLTNRVGKAVIVFKKVLTLLVLGAGLLLVSKFVGH